MWNDVVYKPGEIKIVAYKEDGSIAETKTIKTAGKTYRIKATADRKEISADEKDLTFVTIEILDKDGNLCPKADNLLFFDVEGNVRLKAVCNGDPTDQTSFASESDYMRTFNGKLVVILQSSEKAGKGKLKVYGGHLKPAVCEIEVTE